MNTVDMRYLNYSKPLSSDDCPELVTLLHAAGEMLGDSYASHLPFENGNNFILAELCRSKTRKHLLQLDKHSNLIVRIPQLGLPTSLRKNLLYDISVDERIIDQTPDQIIDRFRKKSKCVLL